MATCRDCIQGALKALRVLAAGDSPSSDDLDEGLDAINDLMAEIHNARGPMQDIDITADYVASENQRVRVQSGFTVAVTLPNSCRVQGYFNPYDYGFAPSLTIRPTAGSTAAADGINYRPIRDGSRVEIVGTVQALYFYRADINSWLPAYGLTLDQEVPLNNRYSGAIDAMVAQRIMDAVGAAEPSPGLARRIASGNSALMLQTGTARDAVTAVYF